MGDALLEALVPALRPVLDELTSRRSQASEEG